MFYHPKLPDFDKSIKECVVVQCKGDLGDSSTKYGMLNYLCCNQQKKMLVHVMELN